MGVVADLPAYPDYTIRKNSQGVHSRYTHTSEKITGGCAAPRHAERYSATWTRFT